MKSSAAWLSLLFTAFAQGAPLSDDAAAKLAEHGMVVIDQPLTQGFSAYIGPEHPVFVTSDSLLMAYHRLFEEDVAQGELLDLANQREFWPELWKKLPAKPLSDAASDLEGHRRCRLVVATALRLLTGNLPEGLGGEEKAAVEAEAGRVEKGEGTTAPEWLRAAKGNPPYISYQAFRPGSFHEGVAVLERYYRFRKWLQEMPLDLADEATRSMAEHLGFSLTGADVDHLSFELGPIFRGEATLFTALLRDAWQTVEPDGLEAWRSALREVFKERQDWRFLDATTPRGSEIARELLPASQVARTPEVLAAAFGSPVAAALLGPEHRAALAAEKQRQAETWGYFQALQALHAAPDPRAPDLLRSESWQRKQLNATLGSWAEYRYALQLSSREDANWRGGSEQAPGFVEPLPDFFNCLGRATGAGLDPKDFRKIADLRLALKLEKLIVHLQLAEAERNGDSIGVNDHYFKVGQSEEMLARLFPSPLPGEKWDWKEEKDRRTVEGLLREFMKKYWQGNPETSGMVSKESADLEDDLSPPLGRLGRDQLPPRSDGRAPAFRQAVAGKRYRIPQGLRRSPRLADVLRGQQLPFARRRRAADRPLRHRCQSARNAGPPRRRRAPAAATSPLPGPGGKSRPLPRRGVLFPPGRTRPHPESRRVEFRVRESPAPALDGRDHRRSRSSQRQMIPESA